MTTDNVNVFEVSAAVKLNLAEQRRVRQKEIDDIRRLLRTPEGRRFLWRMMSLCGVFRNPFTQNSNQTAFNAGMMNVGQTVLADVNEADVTAFAKMQQEYMSALMSKKEAKEAIDA